MITSIEKPVASVEDVLKWQEQVSKLPVSDEICHYAVRLCDAVRKQRELDGEISNRGSISLMRTAQSIAALNGNAGVFPEDIKRAFIPVIAHRVNLTSEDFGINNGAKRKNRIKEILKQVQKTVDVD